MCPSCRLRQIAWLEAGRVQFLTRQFLVISDAFSKSPSSLSGCRTRARLPADTVGCGLKFAFQHNTEKGLENLLKVYIVKSCDIV